jgi:hypothetical protein
MLEVECAVTARWCDARRGEVGGGALAACSSALASTQREGRRNEQRGRNGGNGQQEGAAWRLGEALGSAGWTRAGGQLPSGERDLALSATLSD